jgi:hypothetical protein
METEDLKISFLQPKEVKIDIAAQPEKLKF